MSARSLRNYFNYFEFAKCDLRRGSPFSPVSGAEKNASGFRAVGTESGRNFPAGVGRLAGRVVMKKDANVRDRGKIDGRTE